MPVADAVQPFVGIANENEFYSHHYLAEVLDKDLAERLRNWDDQQDSPPRRLGAVAQRWFAARERFRRARDDDERSRLFVEMQDLLLRALGFPAPAAPPPTHEFSPGVPLPVWHLVPGRLAVLPAGVPPGDDDPDPLDFAPLPGGPPWPDLLSDAVFGADDDAPRFVVLAGLDDWLLLDRYKWPNNRALRFSWGDILDRRDARTVRVVFAAANSTPCSRLSSFFKSIPSIRSG